MAGDDLVNVALQPHFDCISANVGLIDKHRLYCQQQVTLLALTEIVCHALASS